MTGGILIVDSPAATPVEPPPPPAMDPAADQLAADLSRFVRTSSCPDYLRRSGTAWLGTRS